MRSSSSRSSSSCSAQRTLASSTAHSSCRPVRRSAAAHPRQPAQLAGVMRAPGALDLVAAASAGLRLVQVGQGYYISGACLATAGPDSDVGAEKRRMAPQRISEALQTGGCRSGGGRRWPCIRTRVDAPQHRARPPARRRRRRPRAHDRGPAGADPEAVSFDAVCQDALPRLDLRQPGALRIVPSPPVQLLLRPPQPLLRLPQLRRQACRLPLPLPALLCRRGKPRPGGRRGIGSH